MQRVTTEERHRRLGRRHFLAAPAATIEEVAEALVGLHSSDPATPFLSGQARIAEFGVADMEESVYEERTLIRMLGMRRTMFVVPPQLGLKKVRLSSENGRSVSNRLRSSRTNCR